MTALPRHPVTVTASYNAATAADETLERLQAWVADADGRTFVVDESIAPVRWTVTVDYVVDASGTHDAEVVAVERFLTDSARAGVAPPETVVAATGPFA